MTFKEAGGDTGEPHMAEYDRDVRRRAAHQRDRFGQERRLKGVVAVERRHEFGASGTDAGIARGREPAILLMDDARAAFQHGELAQGFRIGRSVVDDDDLEIAKGLAIERGHQLVEKAAAVVARHDNADGRNRPARRHGTASAFRPQVCLSLPFVRFLNLRRCTQYWRVRNNFPLIRMHAAHGDFGRRGEKLFTMIIKLKMRGRR